MASPLETLPSPELLRRTHVLVDRDQVAEAELLVHLGEIDARRLYLEEACPSMYVYCVNVLHFAEGVAYNRIHVARAARRHPELLEAIRRGHLHLTGARLLAPELTEKNARELLRSARHRTAEQVRALLADRKPRPDTPASVRSVSDVPPAKPAVSPVRSREPQLPERCSSSATAPTPPPPEPLGSERYCVRFTADRETWARLEELRALMRHQIPDGDVGKILSRAITALLEQVRRQKFAESSSPRAPKPSANPSRSIPAAIRREVARRDGGRCTFFSDTGRRCSSREFLEFHHENPWAESRRHATNAITLRCQAHNQQQAERDFGARHMARFRKRSDKNRGGTCFESSSEARPGLEMTARDEPLPSQYPRGSRSPSKRLRSRQVRAFRASRRHFLLRETR